MRAAHCSGDWLGRFHMSVAGTREEVGNSFPTSRPGQRVVGKGLPTDKCWKQFIRTEGANDFC